MTNAAETNNGQNTSVEHENWSDLNSMSEEDLIADAMGEAPPAPTEPAVPPASDGVEPPAEEPEISDLAKSLLDALGTAGDEPPAPEAVKPPVDAEKLKELDQLFNDTLGVPISQAVEQMTNFAQTSEATLQRIEEANTQLSLRMQEFELKQQWASDPSVQGKDLNQVVQDRLAVLAPIYSRLAPEIQQKLARAGAQGVVVLWNQTQQGKTLNASQTVPTGRANIAQQPSAPGQPNSLSEIIAIEDEDAYWKALAANSKNQNANDDVGARRSRR